MYYRLADEIGIMYMIEVPLNWWYPKMDEEFSQFAVLAQEAVADLEATFRFFCKMFKVLIMGCNDTVALITVKTIQ